MTATEKYNGWTNYETWCVKLWLDNEQSTQEYWTNAASECWEYAEDSPKSYASQSRSDRARSDLADRLKVEIDQDMPPAIDKATHGTMYADLLNAALSEVNWYEMADAYLEDNCDGFKSFR